MKSDTGKSVKFFFLYPRDEHCATSNHSTGVSCEAPSKGLPVTVSS